jgi:AraC-like DNA-binding protein
MPLTLEPDRLASFFSGHVRKAQRFSFDDVPFIEAPLSVVGGGREFCSPSYSIRREGFPYYAVEFVARGKGCLTLDGKSHLISAGAVFAYGPAVPHHITTDSRDLLEKYFINLSGPRAPQLLGEAGLSPGTVAHVTSVSDIRDIFDTLIRDGVRGSSASNMLCATLSEYLLKKLADLAMLPGARPSPAFATFQRCRHYITTHFRRLRSLEQIANECDIDQAYLCRLFRRFDRQAPYQFLLRLKMCFAAEKLRDPSVLVKEAAISIGFEDPFHFSHAFKNIFGTSPDVFRRLRVGRESGL